MIALPQIEKLQPEIRSVCSLGESSVRLQRMIAIGLGELDLSKIGSQTKNKLFKLSGAGKVRLGSLHGS
jgi:hypothetical protein